jgi:hypothetical protein
MHFATSRSINHFYSFSKLGIYSSTYTRKSKAKLICLKNNQKRDQLMVSVANFFHLSSPVFLILCCCTDSLKWLRKMVTSSSKFTKMVPNDPCRNKKCFWLPMSVYQKRTGQDVYLPMTVSKGMDPWSDQPKPWLHQYGQDGGAANWQCWHSFTSMGEIHQRVLKTMQVKGHLLHVYSQVALE